VAAIYLFVFRRLMDANVRKDVERLDGALSVLEIERETWRRVCEKLGGAKAPDGSNSRNASPHPPAPVHPPAADFAGRPGMPSDTPTGFSIEA
jgi:hypothetical protein